MNIDKILKEAADLKRKNEFLTHKRAMELAKKFYEEEKEPIAGKQNRSFKNNIY